MTREVTLNEWDKTVAPYLHQIEMYSRGLGSYSRSLMSAVAMLRVKPLFETRAEFELSAAEQELANALQAVRVIRQEYASKPVVIEAA